MRSYNMSTTTINIKTDTETKADAQQIFKALGLDMTTAVNLFLRETVNMKSLPFTTTAKTAEPPNRIPAKHALPPISQNNAMDDDAPFLRLLGCHKGIPGASVDDFLSRCQEDKEHELIGEKRQLKERNHYAKLSP